MFLCWFGGSTPTTVKKDMVFASFAKFQHLLSNKIKLPVQNKEMVLGSLGRYFSMRHQNSKVQDLYDHCNNIFSPSGIPPPSSQALQKLSSILDTIKPADVGLKEEAANDDRGLGFFGVNQLNRVARWAKPITSVEIHESDSFTMSIFCFPTSSVLPLHDHPGMTVFSKLLYGSLHVKAYDWVEPPCIVESKGPGGHAPVRLAKLAVDKVLNAPCETSVLYPKHGGNLHCFTAITPCAVLDVLAPPYKENEGRKCTFYHDYPYSTFSAGNGPISVGEEDVYAWLAETEPSNLYMNGGVYAGPSIKL